MNRFKKRNIIILIILFSIILVFLYQVNQSKRNYYQEDLIFFQILNSSYSRKNSENVKEYNINLNKKETKYKKINLIHTIDEKTLINRKIAPGTQGKFNIILSSSKKLKYEIKIIDKNSKPQNLVFIINNPNGIIYEGERKKVEINWKWQYEKNIESDNQDTKDGENLEKYEFEICTIGK